MADAMRDPDSDLSTEDRLEVLSVAVNDHSAVVRVRDDGHRRLVEFVRERRRGWRMIVSD